MEVMMNITTIMDMIAMDTMLMQIRIMTTMGIINLCLSFFLLLSFCEFCYSVDAVF